ncbi:MAG: hypothetical protein AAF495_10105 [Pseudomonadota bacterium]
MRIRFKEEVADFVRTVKQCPVRTFALVVLLANLVATGIPEEEKGGFPRGLKLVEKLYTMEQAVEVALVDICVTYVHRKVLGGKNPHLIDKIGWEYGLRKAEKESISSRTPGFPGGSSSSMYYTLPTIQGTLFVMVHDHPYTSNCNLYFFDIPGKEISGTVDSILQKDDVPYVFVRTRGNPHKRGGTLFRSYKYRAGNVEYSIVTDEWLGDYRTLKKSKYTFMAYVNPGRKPSRSGSMF